MSKEKKDKIRVEQYKVVKSEDKRRSKEGMDKRIK